MTGYRKCGSASNPRRKGDQGMSRMLSRIFGIIRESCRFLARNLWIVGLGLALLVVVPAWPTLVFIICALLFILGWYFTIRQMATGLKPFEPSDDSKLALVILDVLEAGELSESVLLKQIRLNSSFSSKWLAMHLYPVLHELERAGDIQFRTVFRDFESGETHRLYRLAQTR